LLATAVAAVVAGSITARVVARAEELATQYGQRQSVPVAMRELPTGTEIGAGDWEWRELPVQMVGGTPTDEPTGRTVVATILADEPIVTERIAPDGVDGPMALAPDGTRALAIPVDDRLPPVGVGDEVDVLSVLADDPQRARHVARAARVVAVSDTVITVAVESDELGPTARAALEGSAVVALVHSG
jgi:Flp pilus assembly protein CpaB